NRLSGRWRCRRWCTWRLLRGGHRGKPGSQRAEEELAGLDRRPAGPFQKSPLAAAGPSTPRDPCLSVAPSDRREAPSQRSRRLCGFPAAKRVLTIAGQAALVRGRLGRSRIRDRKSRDRSRDKKGRGAGAECALIVRGSLRLVGEPARSCWPPERLKRCRRLREA